MLYFCGNHTFFSGFERSEGNAKKSASSPLFLLWQAELRTRRSHITYRMQRHMALQKKRLLQSSHMQQCTADGQKAGQSSDWQKISGSNEEENKTMTKEEFSKIDSFGIGNPNKDFAKYFIGNSYLKPLTNFQNGEFPLFNLSF